MIITYVFLAVFILMIGYLVYFQVFKSETVISSSYNSRQDLYAEHVIRGDILSSDGKVLAATDVSPDGGETREYPYGRMFAHVVGYVNNGKAGVESSMNFNLLRSHSFFLTQLYNDLTDQKNQGDNVVTTLDYDVQEAAYNALGSNNGAVVVLEADTGKVLAMVSKPDFDPNTLEANWDSIVNDDDSSVLLNRATSGTYPPGSVFKIFTTLEYIHENPNYDSYSFTCNGEYTVGDTTIHCYHNSVHGQESLVDSFANSCNTSYSNIGLSLNIDKFSSLLDDMMFNQSLPGTLSGAKSSFTLTDDASTGKIMQTAIGQGDTTVTPLHMAMVAAAIDEGGTVYAPYVVDHTESDSGRVVKRYRKSEAGTIMSSSDAQIMREFMGQVTARGTASALSGQSYDAYGKTGSAEYDSAGNSHGWFVGFASKDGYSDIAIAVIVEDGGSGSSSAVPVAKKVFDTYFNK
ncbi:MAG: penicillin-binding protein 2 [Clostridiales bacterium]|nr:penicillin-binding protein 2 [Clostridiales bacterium]